MATARQMGIFLFRTFSYWLKYIHIVCDVFFLATRVMGSNLRGCYSNEVLDK